MLLGNNSPVVLRPNQSGDYELISICYIHGPANSEALVGPLPSGWSQRIQSAFAGRTGYFTAYVRDGMEDTICDDPRLGTLPEEWERVRGDNLKAMRLQYRHRITGEVASFDPRLNSDALEARGIKLQTFRIR